RRSQDGPRQHLRRACAALELHHRARRQPRRAGDRPAPLGQRRRALARGRNAALMAGSLGVLVAFTAGLFSFLSPCVLPLFPSYLSFITGMSVADLSTDLTAAARRRVMLHSVIFVLGF